MLDLTLQFRLLFLDFFYWHGFLNKKKKKTGQYSVYSQILKYKNRYTCSIEEEVVIEFYTN